MKMIAEVLRLLPKNIADGAQRVETVGLTAQIEVIMGIDERYVSNDISYL